MKRTKSTPPAPVQRQRSDKQRRVRITITTSGQVESALKRLVAMGLYGSCTADAAERLVCEGLRAHLKKQITETMNPKEQ